MTPAISAGDWLAADASILVLVVAYAVTGVWLRRRLAPAMTGSAALLGSCVGALAAAVVESEVLGLADGLRRAALVTLALLVAVGLLVTTRGLPAAAPRTTGRPGVLDLVGLAVGLVLVLAHWAQPLRDVLSTGFHASDALGYHLPYATHFAQQHAIRGYYYAGPDATSTYQPLNAELLDADLMVVLHRDVLVPFTNLPWTGLALLGAWVSGRSSGRPGRAGLATAIVGGLVGTPLMVRASVGEPLTDVAGIALVLATVALLLTAGRTLGAVALGGAAAGLAMGTKASSIGVGALLLLVIAVAAARHRTGAGRLAPVCVAALAAALTGSLWYVRNLVIALNPAPPAHVPGLHRADIGRFGPQDFSVAHYLGHGGVLPSALVHLITPQWGRFWPALVVLVVLVLVLAVVLPDLRGRVLAVIAAVGIVVYLVTPSGALGPPDASNVFAYNIRYVLPAAAIAVVALAQVARRSRLADGVLALSALALVVDDLGPNRAIGVDDAGKAVAGAFVVAGLLLVAVALVLSRRPGLLRWVAVVVIGLVAVAGTTAAGQHFAKNDHSHLLELGDSAAQLDAANPRVVAVLGFTASYVAQGPDLDRRVRLVGVPIGYGAFRDVASCQELHASLVRVHADVLDVFTGAAGATPQQQAWAAEDQHDVIARTPGSTLYRVDLADSGCS